MPIINPIIKLFLFTSFILSSKREQKFSPLRIVHCGQNLTGTKPDNVDFQIYRVENQDGYKCIQILIGFDKVYPEKEIKYFNVFGVGKPINHVILRKRIETFEDEQEKRLYLDVVIPREEISPDEIDDLTSVKILFQFKDESRFYGYYKPCDDSTRKFSILRQKIEKSNDNGSPYADEEMYFKIVSNMLKYIRVGCKNAHESGEYSGEISHSDNSDEVEFKASTLPKKIKMRGNIIFHIFNDLQCDCEKHVVEKNVQESQTEKIESPLIFEYDRKGLASDEKEIKEPVKNKDDKSKTNKQWHFIGRNKISSMKNQPVDAQYNENEIFAIPIISNEQEVEKEDHKKSNETIVEYVTANEDNDLTSETTKSTNIYSDNMATSDKKSNNGKNAGADDRKLLNKDDEITDIEEDWDENVDKTADTSAKNLIVSEEKIIEIDIKSLTGDDELIKGNQTAKEEKITEKEFNDEINQYVNKIINDEKIKEELIAEKDKKLPVGDDEIVTVDENWKESSDDIKQDEKVGGNLIVSNKKLDGESINESDVKIAVENGEVKQDENVTDNKISGNEKVNGKKIDEKEQVSKNEILQDDNLIVGDERINREIIYEKEVPVEDDKIENRDVITEDSIVNELEQKLPVGDDEIVAVDENWEESSDEEINSTYNLVGKNEFNTVEKNEGLTEDLIVDNKKDGKIDESEHHDIGKTHDSIINEELKQKVTLNDNKSEHTDSLSKNLTDGEENEKMIPAIDGEILVANESSDDELKSKAIQTKIINSDSVNIADIGFDEDFWDKLHVKTKELVKKSLEDFKKIDEIKASNNNVEKEEVLKNTGDEEAIKKAIDINVDNNNLNPKTTSNQIIRSPNISDNSNKDSDIDHENLESKGDLNPVELKIFNQDISNDDKVKYHVLKPTIEIKDTRKSLKEKPDQPTKLNHETLSVEPKSDIVQMIKRYKKLKLAEIESPSQSDTEYSVHSHVLVSDTEVCGFFRATSPDRMSCPVNYDHQKSKTIFKLVENFWDASSDTKCFVDYEGAKHDETSNQLKNISPEPTDAKEQLKPKIEVNYDNLIDLKKYDRPDPKLIETKKENEIKGVAKIEFENVRGKDDKYKKNDEEKRETLLKVNENDEKTDNQTPEIKTTDGEKKDEINEELKKDLAIKSADGKQEIKKVEDELKKGEKKTAKGEKKDKQEIKKEKEELKKNAMLKKKEEKEKEEKQRKKLIGKKKLGGEKDEEKEKMLVNAGEKGTLKIKGKNNESEKTKPKCDII